MKVTLKKAISVLLAVVMVFTSVNILPSTVEAANGWKSITGLRYQSTNTSMTIQYKVAKGEESQDISAYGDFYVHIYPKDFVAKGAKIYLDEGMTTEGTSEYTGWIDLPSYYINFGLGLKEVNLKENTYYSLRFVYGSSDVVYYLYTGSAEDISESTTPSETQTESQTKPDESVDLSEAKANTPSTDNLEGWNEKTSHGGSSVDSNKSTKFYIAKNYDYEGANNDNFFAPEGVWGFFADAKTVAYAGEGANTVSGEAFVFASESIRNNFDSIWINGVKVTDTSLYCQSPTNPDVMTISKSLLDLGDADSKVFYITVKRKTAGDHTFPILVRKYDPYEITVPELDDPNWTPFKYSGRQSNIAVNGDEFYVQTSFKNSITNKENFGLYDKTSLLEQPAWGIPFKDGNANTPFVSFIIGNSASVSAVSVDGVRYPADGIKVANGGDIAYMAQSLFNLNGAKSHIFKVIVYCTNSKQDVAFALKVVGNEVETTTPTQVETSEEATTEPTIPDGATWVSINGTAGEYQYYIPAEYANGFDYAKNESDKVLYFAYKIGAPFKAVKLNGVSYIDKASGAAVFLNKSDIADYKNYKLEVTSADGNTTVPIYIRRVSRDYTPTGLTGSVSKSGLVNISWTASQDAVNDGYTYKVTVGGKDATVTGTTATYQLGNEGYGTYEVVVSTIDGAGNVLASAKTNIEYRAPISFTDDAGQWEKCRYEEIKWTAVEDAVKYAVYVDGKLYQTINDPTQEKTTVPAYAFANGTNASGQPTTVGKHTSAIVAIKDANATVMKNLDDVNKEDIMGQNEFTLYVNYIYGKGTSLWNTSGTDSKWNFTVTEAVNGDITTGADVKVDYNSNGYADLTFNNMGKHAGTDQAWTIKAAIYDEAAKNGELQNLSFNIYGPAALAGQTIRIKCCTEEVRDGTYTGPDDIYEEKEYTFVEEKGYAVIHYSMSFKSKNDSYDLLFGLGELDFSKTDDKTLTLSDADINTVYGLTSMKATGTNVKEADENGNIFVSWTSNVPNRMSKAYTYQVDVYSDAEYKNKVATKTVAGDINNITLEDYAVGTYYVKVSSVYQNTVTSELKDSATITQIEQPDLVITDISVPDGTHYIGDKITVTVKMKNIGNAIAKPNGNNLSVFLYGLDEEGKEYRIGYSICSDGSLDVNGEYVGTFEYDIKELKSKSKIYTFRAVADADNAVNEGDDEDNNEYSKSFKFYDTLKDVTFTKDKSIVATWPASDDAKAYIVEYVENGETKTKTVTENKCDFGDLVAFDEGSTVSVTTVGADDDEHVHATGKPLSDLIISDVSIPKNAYAVGDVIPITLTMKNVGITAGTATGNLTIKPTKAGEILTANVTPSYRFMAEEGYAKEQLAVNQEFKATFNYTVQPEDLTAGTINLGGYADADDFATGGHVKESNEDNNVKEIPVRIITKGTVTLDSNDGNGPVTATWNASTDKGIAGYRLQYVVDGKTITKDLTNTSYTFSDGEGLDNQSEVKVLVKYDGDNAYYDYASTIAMVDLIISNVTGPTEGKTNVNFNLTATIKNIGTAKVAATTNDLDGYGKQIHITLKSQDNVKQVIAGGYYKGMVVGETVNLPINDIVVTKAGNYALQIKVDDAGWDLESGMDAGYIPESNEDNNEYTYNMEIKFQQNPMDWTLFTSDGSKDNTDDDGNPFVVVANGSDKRQLEYKVLDTSIDDVDYKDIYTKVQAYGGSYIAFAINGNKTMVNQTDGKITTKMYFAQVSSDTAENYTAEKEAGIDYGSPRTVGDGVLQTWDGNGYQLHTRSFAAGKYYIVKIVNDDGTYVTLGLRIKGDLGNWVMAKASDNSDPEKVPVVYHDKNHIINGTIYYDSSDLGLASMSIYNGNHLALTTDGTKKINEAHWKLTMAYASVDANGNFKEDGPEDLVCTDNPGTITLEQTSEVFGLQGKNTILIKMPELMDQIPIHSAKGGEKDSEYYLFKVYYDTENNPDDYVYIPMNIVGDIPAIEEVNGLVVSNRGSSLSVTWTDSVQQVADGYTYDLYIDGVLKASNVKSGTYNFQGYDEIGSTHTVKVVGKWCEQRTEKTIDYTIAEPEKEPEEIIPADKPNYPTDDKWVLISGQHILPVGVEGRLSTTNANIYYYTDEDMTDVTGYNGNYISLNGNDRYFTGTTTKIYVQEGDSTSMVSKSVYDSYYSGQTLMNSSNMFQVPNDFTNDTTYYYVVRVAGNNGNTYKDFYFKVVPTDKSVEDGIEHTGKWRQISGQSELSVAMGNSSKLKGTISYLDYPIMDEGTTFTDKGGTTSTGTYTYNAQGYNGYYMSMLGDSKYYGAGNTKISISQGSETVLYAEDASKLTFTEKPIGDQSYSGQVLFETEKMFTVEYATTYYLMKVENGEDITYVPFEVKVNTGDVEILGFQMNTNHEEGGVSEYNPSFRVVSKTSNVMTIGNKLYEVKKMGTVYGINNGTDMSANMTLEGAANSENISKFETTERGKLAGYTTTANDSDYNTYFALTFKYTKYMYASLEQDWSFRAYAVLDNGDGTEQVVYGKNIYTTNMYEIADNLYENQKMGTEDAHNFLYDNILNVVDMYNNANQIANAMFKALGVTSTSDKRYTTINKMVADIHDYGKCIGKYTYSERTKFKSVQVEDELLQLLNNVEGKKQYDCLYDWIYNETETYSRNNGTHYKGCHKLVAYDWDNTIDKDFYQQ